MEAYRKPDSSERMTVRGVHRPKVLSATTLKGDTVVNHLGENLGTIDEIMLDLESGRVAYAVLSFGGFIGMGDKLFAVPWGSLELDTDKKQFIFDVEKDFLKDAPGFDKNNWPDFSDRDWGGSVYEYYGVEPYWRE